MTRVGVLGLTAPETAGSSNPGPDVEFLQPIAAAREALAELARGGDGYAVFATARVLVPPEHGPGLVETVLAEAE